MSVSRKNLGSLLLLFGGKLSVSGVIFLGGIMIARFGGPAESAIFTVGLSLILLFDGLIGAPLDTAAVRFSALHPDERERTNRFEAMAMHLKILMAALVFLLAAGFLGASRRWHWSFGEQSFPFLPCGFALAALLLARSASTGLQIRQKFKAYSAMDAAQGLIRMAGFAGLALWNRAQAALYIVVFGLAALGAALTGFFVFGQKYLMGRWPASSDMARMLRFSSYSTGIIALGTITGRGDLLFLAIANGAQNVSAYSAATLVAMLIAQWALFTTVLTQPKILKVEKPQLRRLFRTNLLLVLLATVFATVLLNHSVLEWGTTFLFGHGFGRSIPILQILLAGALVDLLIVPILMVFCIQTCPEQVFRGEALICALFLTGAACAALGYFPGEPEYAMAWVATGARVLKLGLYWWLFLIHTGTKAPLKVAQSDLKHTEPTAVKSI